MFDDQMCMAFLLSFFLSFFAKQMSIHVISFSSRKHLRTKVNPDFHLTYSKNWGNLGSESK